MANVNNTLMMENPATAMTVIEEILANSEVVVAVWQDPTEQYGVGFEVVKGQRILRECAANNVPVRVSTSAIKCVSREQACALALVKGERDLRH